MFYAILFLKIDLCIACSIQLYLLLLLKTLLWQETMALADGIHTGYNKGA
jgi:hypothetical protein